MAKLIAEKHLSLKFSSHGLKPMDCLKPRNNETNNLLTHRMIQQSPNKQISIVPIKVQPKCYNIKGANNP